ncbi:MAG: RNA polymerase sigma factor [Bacteroidetes bacterium]|nr:MAG: RNA polymerase sigma factor [Bacteroidota bacterium]
MSGRQTPGLLSLIFLFKNLKKENRPVPSRPDFLFPDHMNVHPKLIKDCRRGDRKAQFQLYRVCFPVLMGVCVRYQKDEREAGAVLNAGFLKILNNLDKYRPEVPFEAWIRRIMINTLIDDFRKNRKVNELIEYQDFMNNDNVNEYLDFNEADLRFDAEQLEALIRALPPVSQKVFNLFAIDGYAHAEISELLGISEGTSKWHLHFARKKLQEWMAESMHSVTRQRQ